jgi:hypothetical protein
MRLTSKAQEIPARQGPKLLDGSRRRVEHRQLHRVVARLLGIELRGVAGQPLELKIFPMPRHEFADTPRAVRLEMIPHDDQRPANPPAEVAQSRDDFLAVNRVQKVARIELRRCAVERRRDGHQTRDFTPFGQSREHRGAPGRCPRRRYAGPKRETRFVQEGNDAPALASPLFIRDQSRASHALISAWSRSLAWVGGRCGVQPCARSTRPNER